MWKTVKHLSLGMALIVVASGMLLVSDWMGREGRSGEAGDPATALHRKVRAGERVRVALLKWASSVTLDETTRGLLEGLAERGFEHGGAMELQTFCAEGDMPTAVSMAQRAFGGEFDLVLTVSTPMLQVAATANKQGKVVHVFGAVTDPYAAGVGISRENHRNHPAWLAGVGTFQPVRETLELARRLFPDLKRLGTVINPSEACSQACYELAQKTCAEMGLELSAVTVDNSAAVYEAASALAAQGVQAFVIGGDNTVESAFGAVVKAADAAKIPVLGYASMYAGMGALAGLGANYVDVGRVQGRLAGDVLKGLSPREIPVENVMPLKLSLNLHVAAELRDLWIIPPEVVAEASLVYGRSGELEISVDRSGALTTRAPERCWDLYFLNYVESAPMEATLRGFRRALEDEGLREGKDFLLEVASAQGDMATLSALVDHALTQEPDLLLLTSTPALQAVLSKVRNVPVVFGMVANPVVAGAGSSDAVHLPHITGISTESPYAEGVRVLQECLPGARTVGTLVNPSEVNCVYNLHQFEKALAAQGMTCVSVAVSTPTELPDGIQGLLARRVDAVFQISGNLFFSSFAPISKACLEARVPFFGYDAAVALSGGAAVAVARDYESGGEDMGRVALRILRGESPARIPFAPVSKIRIVVNETNARRYGMTIPPSLRARATDVVK